jgi:hypothetical protein
MQLLQSTRCKILFTKTQPVSVVLYYNKSIINKDRNVVIIIQIKTKQKDSKFQSHTSV